MSTAVVAFLESWIEKNITYLDKNGDYLRAMTLAHTCVIDAAKQGITLNQLDPSAAGMEKIIHDAMHGRNTPIT